MSRFKFTTFLVITLTLWDRVRSQNEEGHTTRQFVNGPTGISVEAAEDRQWTPPSGYVNGPTGYSVAAEEQRNNGVSAGFEPVDVDLEDSIDYSKPQYKEVDVDLEDIDNDVVVNGHTGSSVHFEELNSGNRGVISTDPKEDKKNAQLPKGLHIETTDWSTDSAEWSFKGGEWALVSLPDTENHPSLPAPDIPSPALVVVTTEALKKVSVMRTVEGLENVTLHYNFFLSEGEPPNGVPDLKVYQVVNEKHTTLVATETTRGVWDDTSIELPNSGSFKIVFEGRLNKLGNEIAIDDITISGVSAGAENTPKEGPEGGNDDVTTKSPDAVAPPLAGVMEGTTTKPDVEGGTLKPDQVGEGTEKPEETGSDTEKPQEMVEGAENTQEPEKVTDKPADVDTVTEKAEDTGVASNDTDIVVQGNNTFNAFEESTGLPQQINETESAGNTVFNNNLEQGNESLSISENYQGNNTYNNSNEGPVYTLAQGEEVATDDGTDIVAFADNITVPSEISGDLDNFTEMSEVNQTDDVSLTTNMELIGGENDTELEITTLAANSMENSTVSINLTGNIETENSTLPTNLTGGNIEIENSTPPTNLTGGNNELENSTSPTNLTGVPTEIENSNLSNNLTGGNTVLENATLPTNMTGTLEYNETNLTNNPIGTTVNPNNVTSGPSVLTNVTGPVVSINATNITEVLPNNATGEGNNSTNPYLTTPRTTPDISNPLVNATADQGNINQPATSTPLIMNNSTSPSGVNGTSPGNVTGHGITNKPSDDSGGSSWSVFKVFLTISILGVAVLGFLYWRRQRRRDDEIPVFSRATHSDYHNPTFTDDDANFASRGTGNNYKSFE